MAWFNRSQKNIKENQQREMPDGLWTKCPKCSEIIYKQQLEDNLYTCPKCSKHFRVGADEYIKIIFDEDSFAESDQNLRSGDPLSFTDTKSYTDRLSDAYENSNPSDAMTIGVGKINGLEVSFACMNFNFIGGSMGSVVGEKFYRACKTAIGKRIPFICISASGGARMQESALSLMQMAKTSAVLSELSEAKLPYVSIVTDPTTGGVSASFAMLGDIIIAEPGALVAFAGPRVVEQTIRKKLPEGFQKTEFLLEHGFVDYIAHRKELKQKLHNSLKWFVAS
jgi:acetyl-CoA carboxylase carboxyl transferase subunit beta